MTIHFGKRNPGLLTATSPGDTLYIPFAAYNDSGDSELLSGLSVTDIEVFKNGGVTPRATDSGYSLISDTGMYGDRVGLYRCSIQLFNTADDPSFYAVGSTYHVAIDAVTIDGKTVRFFPAVFEIGTERANLVAVLGDTGAANLDQGRLGVISDSGRMAAVLDTGKVAAAVWTSHATRALTSFIFDTGVADTVWRYADTGGRRVNVTSLWGDTGAADRLRKFAGLQLKADGTIDTGTGQITNTINVTATATTDTGQVNNAVWNGLRSAHTGAGTFGQFVNANLVAVLTDTGAADLVGGRLNTNATATTDTGVINNAVWNGLRASHTAAGSFGQYVNSNLVAVLTDTGAANLDQGRLGVISDSGRMSAVLDTGKVASAIWTSHLTRELTGFAFDTGIQQKLDRYDTGVRAALVSNAASLSTVNANVSIVSGQVSGLSAKVDTGVPASVWQSASRTLTAFPFDTGVAETVWRYTGRSANMNQIAGDTGAATHLAQAYALQNTNSDTGLIQNAASILSSLVSASANVSAIKAQTDNLGFTVAGFVDANIQYVNDVQIIGTGDTGTNNTWGPA